MCVSVSVDPVMKCYGPEGWSDIKALNDAIYYVQCRCVFVCVCGGGGGYFIAFLQHVFVCARVCVCGEGGLSGSIAS